jgi:hypothetical protein
LPGKKSGGGGAGDTLVDGGGGSGGRAVSFTVDASYTVWQLKLIILERMAIHPMDQSLYFFTTGTLTLSPQP